MEKKNPLIQADLSGADLSRADLSGADLVKADLSGADLVRSNLSGVDLRGTNLSRADLIQADLSGANLSGANLSGANLHLANLSGIQALGVNFNQAIFTEACLEAWHINCSTRFTDSICEYVYLKLDQQERRPRKGSFKSGEFAALFQQAVDTVDLIFKDGINWQAFFQSFQELRNQYVGQDLSIQAIEKKRGGAFVVRLEVAEGTDKSSIESNAKHFYEIN